MPDTHGMAVYSSADAVHAPRPTLMASGLQVRAVTGRGGGGRAAA